jgi:hypothetical protein
MNQETEERPRWWEVQEDPGTEGGNPMMASIKVVTMDQWRKYGWPDRPHP